MKIGTRLLATKRVTLSAGDIEYCEIGEGEPVVFCHGLLVDARLWADTAAIVAQAGMRCLILNLPCGAHQHAMRPDADVSPLGIARLVADFCEALGLDRVTLVGNDSGGVIAQLVATRHPGRIARIVLTNSDVLEAFPPRGYGYLKLLPRLPGAIWLMAKVMKTFPFLARLPLAFGGFSRKPLPLALLRSWIAPSADDHGVRRDVGKFLRGVTSALTQQAADDLSASGLPVLLLWGDADPNFTLSLAKRMQARVPQAHLVPIPGGRMYVPLDEPRAVAEGITAFVRDGERLGAPRAATARLA